MILAEKRRAKIKFPFGAAVSHDLKAVAVILIDVSGAIFYAIVSHSRGA